MRSHRNAVILCAIVGLAVTAKTAIAADFEVITATWGAGDQKVDVTEKLQNLVHDGLLIGNIGTGTLGDPTPNHIKELALTYQLHGKRYTCQIPEHSVVALGAPVRIIEAKWHTDHRTIDVTQKLLNLARDGKLELALTTSNLGEPEFGQSKQLFLTFEVGGKRENRRIAEDWNLRLGSPASDEPPPPVSKAPPPRAANPKAVAEEISVPCQKPAGPEPSIANADPSAIERPAFQNTPKSLVKDITSVTSMMVTISDDGDEMGLTSDIIAVVNPASRRGKKAGVGFVRPDGDKDMKTSFEEAVRAITLRYPLWAPGHIDISFGEKSVIHGGPSAGTAFGLLMLSSLEGFDLDPKCAVTGDITVDWKVRKVGGVTAKIRGATLDKCHYAAIPEDNALVFSDMALLFGKSSLWDIQVFSIATLQDAVAIARKDRTPQLTEAIKEFAELQEKLNAPGSPVLESKETRDTLKHILELAPNHLSAKCLLALSEGTAPKTLSMNATYYRLSVIYYPFREILHSKQHLNRITLPPYVTVLARKRLAALRPIANKSLLPLLADISNFIEAMDNFAQNNRSGANLIDRAEKLDAGFAALSSDENLVQKLVHEGY